MKISTFLPGAELTNRIRALIDSSDETVILAALVSDEGLKEVLPNIRRAKEEGRSVTFIFGVSMPSPSSPTAIGRLFELHDEENFTFYFMGVPPSFMRRSSCSGRVRLGQLFSARQTLRLKDC